MDTRAKRACPVSSLEMRSISSEAAHTPSMSSGKGPIVRRVRRDAYELLLIEEADAWFEYLEATRGQTALRYKELEPWAWARLSQRLRAIRTKKQKLKPAAAA
jgi:hypothetical protein